METKTVGHTPGPWTTEPVSDDFEGPINVVSEYVSSRYGRTSANWIAECDLQDDRVAENHANARLIAAAPDMLAFVEYVLEETTNHNADLSARDVFILAINARALLARISPTSAALLALDEEGI
jgi:hypothetical protein